jgi:hypothetical protein
LSQENAKEYPGGNFYPQKDIVIELILLQRNDKEEGRKEERKVEEPSSSSSCERFRWGAVGVEQSRSAASTVTNLFTAFFILPNPKSDLLSKSSRMHHLVCCVVFLSLRKLPVHPRCCIWI